jgi:hypothetical protein
MYRAHSVLRVEGASVSMLLVVRFFPHLNSDSVFFFLLSVPKVHKFGGASLADAALYRTVGDLLIQEARGRKETSGMVPTMAIVSARAGMTDLLVKVIPEKETRRPTRNTRTRNKQKQECGISTS